MNSGFVVRRAALLVLGAVAPGLLLGCATDSPAYQGQRTFDSAKDAVVALEAAAESRDTASLEAILGPDAGEVLSSGDPVADRHNREVFLVAMGQGWTIDRVDSNTKELVVGAELWPFPIPLERDSRGWWFDTQAGKDEILARRIGRNELATIGVLRNYAFAQREYASRGRDGKPAGIYAQRVRSDPGTHNGLYWPTEESDEEPSPLGELAARAASEGYSTSAEGGPRPFHGYYFRVLTRQGASAPGGAADYVVNGEMTRGFAMIAIPAEYLNSGVMTFLVGADGVVYERDLGPDTANLAGSIQSYDPTPDWTIAE